LNFKKSILLNIGLCHLKLKDWKNCEKVNLEIIKEYEEGSSKALYRRAVALFHLERYYDSNEMCKLALK